MQVWSNSKWQVSLGAANMVQREFLFVFLRSIFDEQSPNPPVCLSPWALKSGHRMWKPPASHSWNCVRDLGKNSNEQLFRSVSPMGRSSKLFSHRCRVPRMAEYAEELWDLMQDEKTHVYMCGLKGALAGKDGQVIVIGLRRSTSLVGGNLW